MAARTSLSRSVHVNALGSGAHRLHALPSSGPPFEEVKFARTSSTLLSSPEYIYGVVGRCYNNDISRSGQTPLFQPVSRNRYNECNESFLKNEFFPEFPLLSRILPSICGIVHLDERTGPVPRIFLPSTPALIFLTTEIWNWSLIERERERKRG